VLLFLGVAVVHVLSPNAMVTDSLYVVPVAERMVHAGTISLDSRQVPPGPSPYGAVRRGDKVYPLFPWTISLFVLPAVAAADGAHAVGAGPALDQIADWRIEVFSMSLVVALTAVVLQAVVMDVLRLGGWPERRWLATATALVFAFSTSAWSTASRSAWQHGPSMLCLVVGLWALLRSRERTNMALAAGIALGAAYAVRPTNAIALVVVFAWLVVRCPRVVGRFAAGAAIPLVAFVVVNLRAYGGLLPPYFRGESFGGHAHLATALAGNLVSPARGLFVFNPVLLLGVVGFFIGVRRPGLRDLFVGMGLVAGLHWGAISLFPHWWGGWSYGPRLFTDVVPLLLLLAVAVPAALLEKRSLAGWGVVVALVVAGVVVNGEGALTRSSWCWNTSPNVDTHTGQLWDWSRPQFLAGLRGVDENGVSYETAAGGAAGGCGP
jgi:hypothetical protein